jgi:hypothetical protein
MKVRTCSVIWRITVLTFVNMVALSRNSVSYICTECQMFERVYRYKLCLGHRVMPGFAALPTFVRILHRATILEMSHIQSYGANISTHSG